MSISELAPPLSSPDLAAAREGIGPSREPASSDLVATARQFEGIMIHELMKAMRATVPGEDASFAMDSTQSMFDQAIADGAAGSLGLAPMIARDLGASEAELATLRGGAFVGGARPPRAIAAYQEASHRVTPSRMSGTIPGSTGAAAPPRAYVGPADDRPRAGVLEGGWPRPGLDPVEGELSSSFGWREHPIRKERAFHAGLDIAAPEGAEIRAVAAGTVVSAGRRGGYGNLVELRHEDGTVTRYAHASRVHVRPGDHVEVGETIADVGQTGHATGPHLHFEVRQGGRAIDPRAYLDALRAGR